LLLLVSLSLKAGELVSFADETVCPLDVIWVPPAVLPYVGQDPAHFEVELEADQIDIPEPDILLLTGGAFISQGAQSIQSDEIVFDKRTFTVTAGEAVLQSYKGDRVVVDALDLQLETRIGQADNVQFQIVNRSATPKGEAIDLDENNYVKQGSTDNAPKEADTELDAENLSGVRVGSRGYADTLYFDGHDRERFENVVYSNCVAGDDSVLVEATELVFDHATGVGRGKQVRVLFFGQPIMYFPSVSFPLNNERKTGFLFPTFGYSQKSGLDLRLPFYWNIAPDRDATFEGRLITNRGVQLTGEHRYLGVSAGGEYNGVLRAELMPEDRIFGGSRYGWSYQHDQTMEQWDTNFILDVDLGYVSDTEYLNDFGDSLEVSSTSYLPQTVNLRADPYDIFVENETLLIDVDVSAYQNVLPGLDDDGAPYERSPGIAVSWNKSYPLTFKDPVDLKTPKFGELLDHSTRLSLSPQVDSELVNFSHPSSDKTHGLRLDIQPAVALRLDRVYGAIVPKLTYAYTSYNVSGQPSEKPSSPTRSIFLFEVATELLLERDLVWQGVDYVQTLTPRLSYYYVPYKDQSDLPVFDSGSVGFNNIVDAYLGDGFWGADRIQDLQGFTLGLESDTYTSESGERLMKWTLAQQVYFSDREVILNTGDAPETSSYSPLLGELDFNITPQWTASGFVNWDWDDRKLDEWRLSSEFIPGPRRKFNFTYKNEGDDKRNLQLGINLPLAPRWQLGVAGLFGDSSGGEYSEISLGYDACCWATSVKLVDKNLDQRGDSLVMLTLRLKGLGEFSMGDVFGPFRKQ